MLDFGGRYDGDADGKTNVYIHFARSRDEPDAHSYSQSWTCSVVSSLHKLLLDWTDKSQVRLLELPDSEPLQELRRTPNR